MSEVASYHLTANMNTESTEIEFLSRLRQRVEKEIETYVYECPDDAIGKPWTDETVQKGLAQLQASIVEPYWAEVEIRDTFDQVGMIAAPLRKCVVVADDGKGMLLLFDPVEKSFVLAERGGARLITFGVRGDAVGCFLAR